MKKRVIFFLMVFLFLIVIDISLATTFDNIPYIKLTNLTCDKNITYNSYSYTTGGGGMSYTNLALTNETETFVEGLNVSKEFRIPNLINCNTIDTDATGNLSCGIDATSTGGMVYTNLVLKNDTSTLNSTWDVSNYTAGSNITILGHVISIDFTELKTWLDSLYATIGSYLTSTQANTTYQKLDDINKSYAINSSLNAFLSNSSTVDCSIITGTDDDVCVDNGGSFDNSNIAWMNETILNETYVRHDKINNSYAINTTFTQYTPLTLNQTVISGVTGNLTLTGTKLNINGANIKTWLDNIYQAIGSYMSYASYVSNIVGYANLTQLTNGFIGYINQTQLSNTMRGYMNRTEMGNYVNQTQLGTYANVTQLPKNTNIVYENNTLLNNTYQKLDDINKSYALNITLSQYAPLTLNQTSAVYNNKGNFTKNQSFSGDILIETKNLYLNNGARIYWNGSCIILAKNSTSYGAIC